MIFDGEMKYVNKDLMIILNALYMYRDKTWDILSSNRKRSEHVMWRINEVERSLLETGNNNESRVIIWRNFPHRPDQLSRNHPGRTPVGSGHLVLIISGG